MVDRMQTMPDEYEFDAEDAVQDTEVEAQQEERAAEEEDVWSCKYCSARFPKTTQGRMELATHVRLQHGRKRGRRRGEEASPLGDIGEGDVPPLVYRLAKVLSRHLPKNPGLVQTIIENFHQNLEVLSKNRHVFRSWLSKYGLTPDVLSAVEDAMFGVELGGEGEVRWGHAQGQVGTPTVQWVQTPSGLMPVIITVPSPQSGGQQGQGWQGPVQVQVPGMEEVHRRIDRLEMMMERFFERMASERPHRPAPPPEEPPQSVPVRKVRRPVLGPDGLPVTGPDGKPIFEEYEEPYDPQASSQANLLEVLRTVAEVLRPAQAQPSYPTGGLDEEKLLLKIKSELGALVPQTHGDPELRQQVASLQQLVQELIVSRREEEAYRSGYRRAQEDLLPKLEEIERALREREVTSQMSEQGVLGTKMLDNARDTLTRITSDLKEIVMQQMMLSAAQMGVVDKEAFGAYVASRASPPVEPTDAEKASILQRVRRAR